MNWVTIGLNNGLGPVLFQAISMANATVSFFGTHLLLTKFNKMPLQIRVIGRTWRQPNYPKQLTPKRGSQSSLCPDPNLTWWAYGVISLLFRPGTFPAGGLISPLSSPACDGAFDHLQLIRVTFIFKMQITLKTNKLCSYQYISEQGVLVWNSNGVSTTNVG